MYVSIFISPLTRNSVYRIHPTFAGNDDWHLRKKAMYIAVTISNMGYQVNQFLRILDHELS